MIWIYLIEGLSDIYNYIENNADDTLVLLIALHYL